MSFIPKIWSRLLSTNYYTCILPFFDADEGTPAATAQEQAIEAIAKGLVWLKRSRGKEAE
jgi:hypothetical protein